MSEPFSDLYWLEKDPDTFSVPSPASACLTQWFSYRKRNRARPISGDRRPPSPSKLGDIQPDHWLPKYTTELRSVLHVLALLVELGQPKQNC